MGGTKKTKRVSRDTALKDDGTLDVAASVKRDYDQGMSVIEIAEKLGRSDFYVRTLLRKRGATFPYRAPRLTGQEAARFALDAKREYDNGKSITEIAAAAGRSPNNVRKLMRDNGFQLKQRTYTRSPKRALAGQAAVKFVARATRDLDNGKSLKLIADSVGRSEYSVRRLLEQHGVQVNGRRIQAKEARITLGLRAKKMYKRGMSVKEIAEETGLAPRTVRTALQAVGVQFRYKAPPLKGDAAVHFAKAAKRQYDSGMSIAEIAAAAGRSVDNVRFLMQTIGVTFPQPQRDKKAAAFAKKEYERGVSIGEIARQVGRDPSTVWRYLRQEGVSIRPRATRKDS